MRYYIINLFSWVRLRFFSVVLIQFFLVIGMSCDFLKASTFAQALPIEIITRIILHAPESQFSLRKCDRFFRNTIDNHMWDMVIKDIFPYAKLLKATDHHQVLPFAKQRQIRRLYKFNTSIHQAALFELFRDYSCFIAPRTSFACSVIASAFPSTKPISLFEALSSHHDAFDKVIKHVFDSEDADHLKKDPFNISILQHLCSHYKFFTYNTMDGVKKIQDFCNTHALEIGLNLSSLMQSRTYIAARQLLPDQGCLPGSYVFITDRETTNPVIYTQVSNLIKKDPTIHLILDVYDTFVNQDGLFSLKEQALPPGLKNLILTNSRGNAETLEEDFLKGLTTLECLSTAGLTRVNTIHQGFASYLKSLRVFDGSGFENLFLISHNFLCLAENLQSFNTLDFPNLGYIGGYFMFLNTRLHAFDCLGFKSLKYTGTHFLNGASSMKDFCSEGLEGILETTLLFIHDAVALENFYTEGFEKLMLIGDEFVTCAPRLKYINTTHFRNVVNISLGFMYGNSNLTEFSPYNFVNLENVSYAFMQECPLADPELKGKMLRFNSIKWPSIGRICHRRHQSCPAYFIPRSFKPSNVQK